MQKLIELDKIELNWWRREGVLSNNGNRKKSTEQLQKVFHYHANCTVQLFFGIFVSKWYFCTHSLVIPIDICCIHSLVVEKRYLAQRFSGFHPIKHTFYGCYSEIFVE